MRTSDAAVKLEGRPRKTSEKRIALSHAPSTFGGSRGAAGVAAAVARPAASACSAAHIAAIVAAWPAVSAFAF